MGEDGHDHADHKHAVGDHTHSVGANADGRYLTIALRGDFTLDHTT